MVPPSCLHRISRNWQGGQWGNGVQAGAPMLLPVGDTAPHLPTGGRQFTTCVKLADTDCEPSGLSDLG